MTANRLTPTIASHPSGRTGQQYTDDVAEEITALWKGITNQVGSIGGSANAITGSCAAPLAAAPQHGETFRLTPGANNTGSVTVNIDTTGAIALVDEDGNALIADDIVSGRPIVFWYDSTMTSYRIVGAVVQSLVDAAVSAALAATKVEVIGDTTIGGSVAQVEHSWTADRYAKVVMLALGVSLVGGSGTLTIDLRYAGGSVLASGSIGGGTLASGANSTLEAAYVIDTTAGRRHIMHFWGFAGSAVSPTVTSNTSANVPDRVRISGNSNLDAGRIVTLGYRP